MSPTLEAWGDWVIISKLHTRGRGIAVGDVVNFRHPLEPDVGVIKRVVGMAGDFVERTTPGKGDGSMIQVPEGHCWVIGDNLPYSHDSRLWGPLPLALIRGKVIARCWPRPKWIENSLQNREF
ncbi:MAG: hypothetical protein M1829_004275 [Trizodia sp. TS-e1964]|nr:MAG: hypothetical protein M1829_004275 [Trizodia sp. TS-e1964]